MMSDSPSGPTASLNLFPALSPLKLHYWLPSAGISDLLFICSSLFPVLSPSSVSFPPDHCPLFPSCLSVSSSQPFAREMVIWENEMPQALHTSPRV